MTNDVEVEAAPAERDIPMPMIQGKRSWGITIWEVPNAPSSRPWSPENGPRVPMIYREYRFRLPVGKAYTAYEPRPLWWQRALARTKRLFGRAA